jgi:hypothetical protein
MSSARLPPFFPLGSGRLALWHRPGRKAFASLAATGCHRVVTLLSAREGAEEIGAAVRAAGMSWSWLPLASGRPPEGRSNGPVCAELPRLAAALAGGESVLLHCSAGMHRTGMITLALLGLLGLPGEEALARLEELRPFARLAMTPAHLAWAEATSSALRAADDTA